MTLVGLVVVAVSTASLVLARLFGLPELFVAGLCGLGAVMLATAYTIVRRPRLAVSRDIAPVRVHAGTPCRVDVRLVNRGRLASPVVQLRDQVTGTAGADLWVAPLGPGAETTVAYRLPTQRRGVVEVGPLTITSGDPLGLTRRQSPASPVTRVVVFPRVDPIDPPVRASGDDPEAEALRHDQLSPSGHEFHSLREYVVGDDLRRVHWRASARNDELMIRLDEMPWQGRTTVVLDTRPDASSPAAFEDLVSAAASICVATDRRGDQLRLVTTDGADTGFAAGRSHLVEILELLAVIGHGTETDLSATLVRLRQRGGGSVVAVLGRTGAIEQNATAQLGGRLVLFTHAAATPPRVTQQIASRDVILIGPDDEFAARWQAAMGRGARRRAPGGPGGAARG